jgi:ABC-type transport system involved in multi-copper enzyme maturation permease subunit
MRILAVILNTFREAIRHKVLFLLIGFAFLVIISAKLIQPLALGEHPKIARDMGLSALTLFGLLIAIFIGTRLVYEEIEKRTLYLILPKPVKRWEFLLGKYLGLLLVITMSLVLISLLFFAYLAVEEKALDFGLLVALPFIWMELSLITAIALFFSTFTTPIASGVFTFLLFFAGHLSRDIMVFGELAKAPWVKGVAIALYHILPNLSNFNVKGDIVNGVSLSLNQMVFAFAYGALYIALLLFLSILVFEKKDL